MENLTESDARMIPGFGPGQGIVSGQVVRFPLPVWVKMDDDLLTSEIGDEDFFAQAEAWRPDEHARTRAAMEASIATVEANRKRPAPSPQPMEPSATAAPPRKPTAPAKRSAKKAKPRRRAAKQGKG